MIGAAILVRDAQWIIELTGGINGVFILLIFPSIFVLKARQKVGRDHEFTASLKSNIWPIVILVFGGVSLTVVLYGIFFNKAKLPAHKH